MLQTYAVRPAMFPPAHARSRCLPLPHCPTQGCLEDKLSGEALQHGYQHSEAEALGFDAKRELQLTLTDQPPGFYSPAGIAYWRKVGRRAGRKSTCAFMSVMHCMTGRQWLCCSTALLGPCRSAACIAHCTHRPPQHAGSGADAMLRYRPAACSLPPPNRCP